MSASNLAVSAVVVVCFYGLWWGLSLSRRLGRLERHSKLDPLTGLGSGDWLYNERWPAALRSGRPLGIVYLDLDHLKLTNDSLGHAAGDQYIRTAAEALSHVANAQVWGIQCDFHHLPLYAELFESTKDRPHRRLFCMLGGTLANLDQEPRFLRQSLLKCEEGDLLLLDIQSISAAYRLSGNSV